MIKIAIFFLFFLLGLKGSCQSDSKQEILADNNNLIIFLENGISIRWQDQITLRKKALSNLKISYGFTRAINFNAIKTSKNEVVLVGQFTIQDSTEDKSIYEAGLWNFAYSLLNNNEFQDYQTLGSGWQKSGPKSSFNYIQGFYLNRENYSRQFILLFTTYKKQLRLVIYTSEPNINSTIRLPETLASKIN